MARKKKRCACGCGQWFVPTNNCQKYVSSEHAQRWWNRMRKLGAKVARATKT